MAFRLRSVIGGKYENHSKITPKYSTPSGLVHESEPKKKAGVYFVYYERQGYEYWPPSSYNSLSGFFSEFHRCSVLNYM